VQKLTAVQRISAGGLMVDWMRLGDGLSCDMAASVASGGWLVGLVGLVLWEGQHALVSVGRQISQAAQQHGRITILARSTPASASPVRQRQRQHELVFVLVFVLAAAAAPPPPGLQLRARGAHSTTSTPTWGGTGPRPLLRRGVVRRRRK